MLARACLNRSCPPNPKKHDRPKHLFQAIGIERGGYIAAEPDLGRRNSARPSPRTAARKLRATRKFRATCRFRAIQQGAGIRLAPEICRRIGPPRRGLPFFILVANLLAADLAADGLGQLVHELDDARILVGRRRLLHVVLQLLDQLLGLARNRARARRWPSPPCRGWGRARP